MQATRHDHKPSSQRAGHGHMAGASRRAKNGLSPARIGVGGVGGAARESVFHSSVRAVSRIEVSRPETYKPGRDES